MKMKFNEAYKTFKGSEAEYRRIHRWVEKSLGRASKCVNCETTVAKSYDWSNISGKYLQDIVDWERLCHSCHMRKDLKKDKCPSGHPLKGGNLKYSNRGGRQKRECRTCAKEATRQWRLRVKEQTS